MAAQPWCNDCAGRIPMTIIDWLIVGTVGLSMAFGVWRGLVREVFALAAWVAAFVVAVLYGTDAAGWMPATWNAGARSVAGHVAVFMLVLIAGGLIGWLASRVVRAAGLGVSDRMLGGVFGAVRGALVVGVAAILASLTTLPRSETWRQSLLMPYVRASLLAARPWLPEGAARAVQTASRRVPACVAASNEGVRTCAESSA